MSGMKISELDFVRLLPSFMRDDNAVIALSQAINRLMGDPDNRLSTIRTWDKIDELNEAECDELAWELDIDWYDSVGMSLEKKRATIKLAQQIKRKRGTKWAIEQILSFYFGDSYVLEWHEMNAIKLKLYDTENNIHWLGSRPFTFAVLTTNAHLKKEDFDKFVKVANSAKNEHSHIAGILFFWKQDQSVECALSSGLHRYNFEPCGTRDRPATIGFAVRHSVETEPEEKAQLYDLPKVGTVRASLVGSATVGDAITATGTYEKCGARQRPATLGTVQKTAAAVQPSTDCIPYNMTKCGAVRAAVVGTAIVGKTTIETRYFIKCGAGSAAIVGSAIVGIAVVTS